ncbi:MAG: hypothetical protein SOW50_03215, partial [Lachnospiraceae bacterium]|nr:hypothetical protein [Lachnospiraceae bacterium]
HGILKLNKQKGKINAFVTENIGPLLKNAHYVNDIISSEKHPNGQRVYISAIADEEGFLYPARIIVDKDTSVVSETEVINRLYAINAKKVVGQSPLGYGYESQPSTTSTLSVSDLFDYVKDVDIFKEIMPISSGVDRVDSEIGRKLKYSKGVTLEDLGRTKDLVAAHNLSENNFLASINLGGFVFPSVAVTKDSVGHENYGDITLLFDKKTIDPSNRNNRVYSGDAWTPTYPTIDYDVDTNTTQAISKQLNDIVDFDSIRSLDNNYFLYNLQNGSQLNDALNEHRGDISTLASDNNALKYIFLTKSGQNIEIPRKPKELNLKGNYTKGRDASNYVLDALLNSGYTAGSFYDMSFEERTNAYYDVIKNAIADYYNKAYSALQGGQFGTNLVEDFDNYSADYILEQVDQYLRTANEGVVDIQGLKANLNNAIIQYGDNFENDFADWIRNNITSKIRYNTGIRNDKDMFTPSGNRRSFAQLHDPYTAQNVLKYMKKQTGNDLRGAKNDSWGVGPGEIISTQLKEFRSIDEIIQNEGLIKNLNDEEFNQTYKTVYDSIYAISKEISSYIEAETGSTNYFELNDSSLQLIKDCMRKNSKKQMYDLYMKEFYPYANFKMSEENVSKAIDAIYGLKESIGDLPTRYFEAKPMRIVGLDEIQLAIIPNNSSDYLKETLNNLGINYVEYDPSVEGSRQS